MIHGMGLVGSSLCTTEQPLDEPLVSEALPGSGKKQAPCASSQLAGSGHSASEAHAWEQ